MRARVRWSSVPCRTMVERRRLVGGSPLFEFTFITVSVRQASLRAQVKAHFSIAASTSQPSYCALRFIRVTIALSELIRYPSSIFYCIPSVFYVTHIY
jgi:hypothetical protein